MALYPLLLEPIYKEKVWGGRALERFDRVLPGGPEYRIGESWELVDLDATSPSGGGGGAAHSPIGNGPLMKRGLGEVVSDFGPLVVGTAVLTPEGKFPLLVKYLDARENLSVQVHPSPAYAAANPEAHEKSEAWYVVAAEPGSLIYKGVVEGTTPERFEAAIEAGTVADLMIQVPARAGDCHYLPSGTCHALGGGILVAEVQTPSDTTFRVFDWGRRDRELHVEPALECIDFGPVRADQASEIRSEISEGVLLRSLVRCAHFTIDEWTLEAERRRDFEFAQPTVLMVIAGRGWLEWGRGEGHRLPVPTGRTVLLPAALGRATFSTDSDATILEVGLPTGSV
ncbi:MAG: class I mannose-6-phosphate isomerase [Gemmatimonadetes bacterium]|nr:class I mannose-6-phosphate isomerase [Gemmatimonadota bacterium]MDA1103653.1 class I mannose-6-phosphate isomerase [Gemmatimonadota bacterium]